MKRTVLILLCMIALWGVSSQAANSPSEASPLDELARGFQQPPHSAKTGVFWFWVNGNITREGITADLEAMARVGIGRVVIFEVSGDIPGGTVKFLSDEWRALFRHALAEANRLDVKLNINNDAGWCGSGGPWNTPENSMQKLVSTRTGVEGGKPVDAVLPQPPAVKGFYRDILVLATKALPAGDDKKRIWPRAQAIDLTSRTDASGRLRWDPPAGTWDILRIGHTSTGKDNHPAPESGCGPECDKLSKAAVKAHFDGMMAKLISDAGPLAGKTLEHTHIDSWEVGTQNWTPAFRAEFQRLRGYDPLPFLPGELGYIVDDAETQRRFQWDMRVTISDLMLENYAGYFRELASSHGLKLSVEAYGAHPGHCPVNNLAYAGRSDIPIGEFWVGHDNYRSCKEMASASHVYGKRLVGAEAFTAWPDNARFQFHPGNIKVMGDQSFCVGVNRLMLHCYTHQPWLGRAPGMTMQGWGTHFDRTQTWWEQSKAWHTYIARCQYLLQSGLFAADLCYLDVEDAPRDAPYPLRLPGYDYDVCPAEVVKNRMSVKNGRITLPDGMSYSLLVLPPTDRMTPETLRSVVALAKAGAVIAATTLPSQSPSLQNHPQCDAEVKALARELFGELGAAPVTGIREIRCGAGKVLLGGNVTQALTSLGIQPDVTFTNAGKDGGFRWIHRRTDTADFYFIANQLAEEKQVTCTFRVAGAQPELWHPETGTISALPVCQATADGRSELPLKFGPHEAFFVVFRKGGQKVTVDGVQKPGRNWLEFTPTQTIDGAWKVTFDPKWGGPEKPVVFEALTDWSSNVVEGVRFYSGTAVYRKTIDVDPAVSGLRSVFLDLGQVEVMADVKLNGKDLGTLWKKPFRIDVTGHLKPGANALEILVVNLWCNRLIGDQQLPEDAEWKNGFMGWGGQFEILKSWPQWLKDGKPSPGGRFTFSTASYYKKGDALKPSGLLGPVQLLTPVGISVGAATHGAGAQPTPKMPWEDPYYAKDISSTQADSRAGEGWTEFIRHHEDRKSWVTEKKVDILMIGDSIVFGWSREGHEVWNEHYGTRNAVNIGSSGDRTSHMLWHIQDGGLDGMKDRNPKVVVIMIGTNNRGAPANEGRDTAQGVLAILKEVHHRLPASKILLLAIFPCEWKPIAPGRIRNDQVNGILKTYADNKTVYWLDLKETFVDKDGMLQKELMPDALHPNVEGYRVWAKAMEPMLTKLLESNP